jgi:hypothetical protein
MRAPIVFDATWFDGLRHNVGERIELDFPRFFESCALHRGARETLPLISPATFVGNKVLKANVIAIHALVLDCDELGATTPEQIAGTASHALGGAATAVSTTWNSRPGALRARLICSITRDIMPDEYPRVWSFARDALAASGIEVDGACCDPSRRFFIPACAEIGQYQSAFVDGVPFDVKAVPEPVLAPRRIVRPSVLPRGGSYTKAAIAGVYESVASAPKGERNSRLYVAACRLRELGAHDVEGLLLEAGQVAGLGKGEILKTIASTLGAA